MTTKIYDMRDVWTDAGTVYTAVEMNAFDINSEISSKLLDLKKNGISQFTVNKLGEIVVGTLDIPRVNSLEEAITALSASGLSKVDHISANTTVLNTETNFNAGTIAMVYADPIINNNDWYIKVGASGTGSWSNTGLLPKIATYLTPKKPVARTFYVTMDGNDGDALAYVNQIGKNGHSIYKSFQTINAALKAAANTGTWEEAAPNVQIKSTVANTTVLNTDAALPSGIPLDTRRSGDAYFVTSENKVYSWTGNQVCVVIVHPGEYQVQPFTQIPPRVTLYGYDARATVCTIAEGYSNTNMFMLNSGCKVRGMTIKGLRHEDDWNPTVFKDGPPKYGYAFAFANNAYISRSPYISDCATLHSFSIQEMSLPQDRLAGNPLIPRGMGNLYADGSQCDPDSPLRSVVVDSYTAVNPNGVAYAIVNDAIVQLVSIFTNWSRVGIWTHAGGQATIVNSNSTFGDYAFVSTGYRFAVRVPDITDRDYGNPALLDTLSVDDRKNPMLRFANCVNVGTYMANSMNIEAIANELYDNRYPTIANWSVITSDTNYANLTARDTRTIIRELGEDLKSGQDSGLKSWVQALFKTVANTQLEFTADSVSVFDRSILLNQFIGTFNEIRKYAKELTITIPGASGEIHANTIIDSYMNLAMNVVSNPLTYTTVFKSTIEAASQQFSYAGSGVNYNALPFGQRSSGKATDPNDQIYTEEGGVIYATYNTEQGDTYLGKDLRVDFERSVIEGQAFSRGVQNIVLPLIIGIGG